MKIGQFLNKYIFKLNVVFGLALLMSYMTAYLPPSQLGVLPIFGLFYPFILAINILFVLYWSILKSKKVLLSGLIIFLGFSFISNYVTVNTNSTMDNTDISLLTYNSTGFNYWNKRLGRRSIQENIDDFRDLVLDKEPDIIFIQEKYQRSDELLNTKDGYPYFTIIPSSRLSIFSKHKLGSSTFKSFGNSTNGVLYTLTYLPNDTIQLVNVHFNSNRIGTAILNKLDTDKLDDRETWSALKMSIGSYLKAAKLRTNDYQYVDSIIRSSPHRSIIAGDFNEVAMSHLYHNLSETHTDAFVEAGHGFSATYKRLLGALRIDYIFVDPSMEVTKYDVIKPSFSDHYPVIAHISLASQADN